MPIVRLPQNWTAVSDDQPHGAHLKNLCQSCCLFVSLLTGHAVGIFLQSLPFDNIVTAVCQSKQLYCGGAACSLTWLVYWHACSVYCSSQRTTGAFRLAKPLVPRCGNSYHVFLPGNYNITCFWHILCSTLLPPKDKPLCIGFANNSNDMPLQLYLKKPIQLQPCLDPLTRSMLMPAYILILCKRFATF
jgi:hypothetical protein